jgi:hypothetical protein
LEFIRGVKERGGGEKEIKRKQKEQVSLPSKHTKKKMLESAP